MKKVVSLALIKEGKILLEKHVKCKGLWVLPGGKVEDSDRDLKCALQREIKEELGIELKSYDLARLFRRNSTYDRVDGVITYDEHVYLAEYNDETMGEIANCEPDKHSELKWFDMKGIIAVAIDSEERKSSNVYNVINKLREVGTAGMLSAYMYKTRVFDLTSYGGILKFLKYVIVEDGNMMVDVFKTYDQDNLHLIVNRGGMGKTSGINVECSTDAIPIKSMTTEELIKIIRKLKTGRYQNMVTNGINSISSRPMSLIPDNKEEETLVSLGEFDINIGFDENGDIYGKLCEHNDLHKVYLSEDDIELFNKGATMAIHEFYMQSLLDMSESELIMTAIHPNAVVPERCHDDDSGMDLFSVEEYDIEPGETKLVKTGIKIILPKNHEAQIRPKSGLALKKGLSVLNTPGTIDEGYRGEVCVILINHGKETVHIGLREKVAQMVIAKVEKPNIYFVNQITYNSFETERGEGGFGSTGLLVKSSK